MAKRLSRKFYCQPTLEVTRQLLGKYIVRRVGQPRTRASSVRGQRKLIGKIVETEAYLGPKDKASHAYGGKVTLRNRAEYLVGGHIYIYLVYGMYWQMNISTFEGGKPECVLIRALEPVGKFDKDVANGPGKLCRWLKLNKSFYGEDLTKSKRIWLEDPVPERARYRANRGEKISPRQIVTTKRIGIDYAGPYWANKRWRFYIKGNKFVSVK